MHRFRTVALTAATVALVVSAFGAPASAAFGKGSIAVVNGRPGPRLDICIGNAKIKRNLPYGGKTWRQLSMGDKVLRAYLANGKAKCGGVKVAQYPFTLIDGGDFTFVVTRKSPTKVVVYDNLGYGSVQPTGPTLPGSYVLNRTASDLAAINVYVRLWQPIPDTPVGPSIFPIFVKGDQFVYTSSTPGAEWQARATFPEKLKSIALARRQELQISRRYEWVFVGTSGKNARWVKFSRPIYSPGP